MEGLSWKANTSTRCFLVCVNPNKTEGGCGGGGCGGGGCGGGGAEEEGAEERFEQEKEGKEGLSWKANTSTRCFLVCVNPNKTEGGGCGGEGDGREVCFVSRRGCDAPIHVAFLPC